MTTLIHVSAPLKELQHEKKVHFAWILAKIPFSVIICDLDLWRRHTHRELAQTTKTIHFYIK